MSNTNELRKAIRQVNNDESETPVKVILRDGNYQNSSNLLIRRANVTFRSEANDASKVILTGRGMQRSSAIDVIFDISADNITIDGLTIRGSANHLIQVRAERDADHFTLRNCILQDSYQQLLKISGNQIGGYSDNGIIDNNRFEYTAGVGPNNYIGGIDAHRARFWKVTNNRFYNIASPKERVAEHAIHFWNGSSENEVTYNLIVNSDRGIGFGLNGQKMPTYGGLIAYNDIIHTNIEHPFADVGIVIENSPHTRILGNLIHIMTKYPNAIEYRFPSTFGVTIEDNITNKAIVSRDGASGVVINNSTSNTANHLYDVVNYHLHRLLQ